jgi:hypothetical protein
MKICDLKRQTILEVKFSNEILMDESMFEIEIYIVTIVRDDWVKTRKLVTEKMFSSKLGSKNLMRAGL